MKQETIKEFISFLAEEEELWESSSLDEFLDIFFIREAIRENDKNGKFNTIRRGPISQSGRYSGI